jgi:predicted Zn-dependent protease with MMP-like domain
MTFPKEPTQSSEVAPSTDDSGARVKAYVLAALDSLPREYAGKVENVQFFIRDVLSTEDSERLGIRRGGLYGLYEGIPLTRRGDGYNLVVPDRITIFWGPLVRDFPKQEALAAKVKKVVYHEIGHYFGLNEAELSHTRMK